MSLISILRPAIVTTLAVVVGLPVSSVGQGVSDPPLTVRYARKKKAVDDEEMVVGRWYNDLALRLAGSQVGFQNWQGGGLNSLALSAGIDGSAAYKSNTFKQTHELKLGLGGISQDDEDLRKSEDVILASTVWQYLAPSGFLKQWQPTLAASLLTQFLPGYNYKAENQPKVSDFFAPAYLTQSLGLTRELRPWLSQRFGFAGKETIVVVDSLRVLYGNEIDQRIRVEGGFESRTDLDKEIATNVRLKTSLGIFAAFGDLDSPDVNWSNLVTMKVNNWLNVNFELVTLYDRDVSTELQIREVLSVGLLFVLI